MTFLSSKRTTLALLGGFLLITCLLVAIFSSSPQKDEGDNANAPSHAQNGNPGAPQSTTGQQGAQNPNPTPARTGTSNNSSSSSTAAAPSANRGTSNTSGTPSPASGTTSTPAGDTPAPQVLAGSSALVKNSEGKLSSVAPDELGIFPRINVKAAETITVDMKIPGGKPGQILAVEAQDGGLVESGQMATYLTLNADNSLPFKFKAGTQLGVYRIEVRTGEESRQFDFWVDPKD